MRTDNRIQRIPIIIFQNYAHFNEVFNIHHLKNKLKRQLVGSKHFQSEKQHIYVLRILQIIPPYLLQKMSIVYS